MDINNKRPLADSKDEKEKQMGYWITSQLSNSKTQTKIMKNDTIYNIWKNFIESDKYKIYFLTNEELWIYMFYQLKQFIDTTNKRPTNHSKNKIEKKLGSWLLNQIKNCKTQTRIMKNYIIYNLWIQFIESDKYKKFFK